jgi:beta-phosphoglucomutase-like phosphatase (HAD superfamily)
MTHAIKAILFDLDGTLIDSETPGLDVLHEQAARLGVPITREQVHADFRGMRMSLIVESIGARLARRPVP